MNNEIKRLEASIQETNKSLITIEAFRERISVDYMKETCDLIGVNFDELIKEGK